MATTLNLSHWIAALLAVSAIVFALAITVESHPASSSGATVTTAAEGTPDREAAEHSAVAPGASAVQHDEPTERVLGINLEDPVIIWGFVAVSLLLAAAVWRMWRPAFYLTVLVAGASSILDMREIANQLSVQPLVAMLAVVIAGAHLAAALLAVLVIMKFRAPVRAT